MAFNPIKPMLEGNQHKVNRNVDPNEDLGFCEHHKNQRLERGLLGTPRCYLCDYERLMQMGKEFDQKVTGQITENKLEKWSLVDDRHMLESTFDSFEAMPGSKEESLKKKVLEVAKNLAGDDSVKKTMILSGPAGSGKTHLAMATLKYIQKNSEQTCLFVNMNTLLRHIKSSFNDPSEFWTEAKAISKMKSADVLCIDDLGTESAMTSGREATNFVQNILYETLNVQQRVIITTNLTENEMAEVYNDKNVSRLFKHSTGTKFDFSGVSDKRRG